MSDLPEEMIEEILSRVAVKSLLRFRCVSKAWRSLMGSKRFIRKQLKNSKTNTNLAHQRALLCPGILGWQLFECPLLSLFSKPDIHASGFNFATSCNIPVYSLELVGCCNGLVCILCNSKEYVLWNPCTRISKKLPHLSNIVDLPHAYGFGCDEWSGDYKVVVIFCNQDYSSAHVYSLKSDSWKKISNAWGFALFIDKPGKLENGKLHWKIRFEREKACLEFDLKREVFEMVEEGFWSWKKKKRLIVVRIDEYSSVENSGSLVECIDPQGGFMNLWITLLIIDRTSPVTCTSAYDVHLYIQSLETLDLSTYTDNIKGKEEE